MPAHVVENAGVHGLARAIEVLERGGEHVVQVFAQDGQWVIVTTKEQKVERRAKGTNSA